MPRPAGILRRLDRTYARQLIVGAAAIGALGTFATHSILPALNAIRHDLHSALGTTNLIVSLSLLALAVGNLVVAPLSDRFGRRPVILTGLAMYVIGSVAGIWVGKIGWLIAARIVQAFGSGGAMSVARASIMDYFGPERAAQGIGYAATAILIVPMFAPTLGGYLAEFLGWRWIFAACALLGVAALTFTWVRLGETRSRQHRPAPLRSIGSLQCYGILLRSPQYLAYVAFGSFMVSAVYVVITGAPYVVIEVMHLAPSTYGKLFLLPALGSFSGFLLAARITRRRGTVFMLKIGLGCGITAALVMAALALAGFWQPLAIFLPAMLLGFSNAVSTPSSMAGAIGTHPEIAGAASGLMGFIQLCMGALCTQLVAVLADRTPIPLVLLVLALALLALVSFLVMRRQVQYQPESPEYDGSSTVAL
jgi:MFS transporter, DHA1 family, multidrug resistance protein